MERILVGTDTSASADLAVTAAARLAAATGAELMVVYVRPDGASIEAADPRKAVDAKRYVAEMPARFSGVRTRSWIDEGDAAERLCALAVQERANTIVVGNKDAGGSRWRLRESVPTAVVRAAPCAVFVVDTRDAW